jgi:hypothetical protein
MTQYINIDIDNNELQCKKPYLFSIAIILSIFICGLFIIINIYFILNYYKILIV